MVARDGAIQIQRRVLYIGSAVPLETSEGLDALQQPLKERYPCDDDTNIQGVDAVLTILPGGLQLHYITDPETVIWFPISSLTLCAAVRCIHITDAATGEKLPKFISLSNPASQGPNSKKPAVFTAITRRTTGKKVLECHGFVCSSDKDALDLVQSAKTAGYRSRYVKGPGSHIGPPNGRLNTSVLRNESFSSRSTHNPALRLVPGSPLARKEEVASEFFDTPPAQGYFYSGGSNHVRSYTLNRVNRDSSPNRPQASTDHAASTLPQRPVLRRVMSPPPPRHSPTIPVRRIPVGHPPPMPPPRRFFSPPPPPPSHRRYGYGLLNQPRDPFVFMPPPPIYVDSPYAVSDRHMRHPRGSESSGESGSRSPSPHANGETSTSHGRRRSSSGSSTLRRDNKLPHHHHHHHHHHAVNGNGAAESSSEVSSRPSTPPVNHDANRMSRKERYDLQRSKKSFHEPNSLSDDMYSRRVYPGYPGYYFYGYPPMDMPYGVHPRHLSMPPPVHRLVEPAGRRNKKDKGKKKKKKKPQKHLDDVSTDSYGYASEIPAAMMDRNFPSIPRDFRRTQFKNERAFVNTYQEGSRRGYFSNNPPTAYVLNQPRGSHPPGELDLDEP